MKYNFTPYIYILFFSAIFTSIKAQNIELKLIPTDSVSNLVLNSISYKKELLSQKEIQKVLDTIILQVEQQGFFNAQFQKIKGDEINSFHLTAGQKFSNITLYVDKDFDLSFLKTLTNVDKDNSLSIPINQLQHFLKSVLNYYEKQGYPFVEVKLMHQKIENNLLSAFIDVKLNKQRTIDKIQIEGYTTFPKSFIKYQTPLRIGSSFNQNKLIKTEEGLSNLSFASFIKPPEVLFTNDSTTVYLYLKKKKSHQLDGLLGFGNSEKSSKVKLYGYAAIQLNNILNKGEQFGIYWQNTSQKQTTFKLNSLIPYIFNTPISVEGSFNLEKQDSTYLTTHFDLGFSYPFGNHSITTEIQSYTSNVLANTTLTSIDDYKKTFYGVGYRYQLNNSQRFFPTIIESQLKMFTGTKKINTQTDSHQKIEFLINYDWELNARNFIFIQNQTKRLFGNQFLLNELFQIGGTNSIRGFNENQLLSSAYSIFNLEYRYITSSDSYFYSITDYGTSQNKTYNTKTTLFALGFGYVFKLNNGFLNLSFSIGKFSDTSFDMNQTKVSLKWIQKF